MERQPTDFGKVVRLPEKVYPSPEVYPEKNAHPRLMFTRKSLETVRKNLSVEENQPAFRQYLAFSEEPATGVLETLTVPLRPDRRRRLRPGSPGRHQELYPDPGHPGGGPPRRVPGLRLRHLYRGLRLRLVL